MASALAPFFIFSPFFWLTVANAGNGAGNQQITAQRQCSTLHHPIAPFWSNPAHRLVLGTLAPPPFANRQAVGEAISV
jgi:hypothetical protein